MIRDIFTCESENEFLENKYDLHKLNAHGMNALFVSDLEKSKWLIKHGINLYHLDCDYNNVIMNISSSKMDKAQYLLDIGYDLSFFIINPDKLTFGNMNMRSQLVMRLIQTYIPKCLQEMAHKEKENIKNRLNSEKIVIDFPSKKRRL